MPTADDLQPERPARSTNGPPSIWTDGAIETLKALWQEGFSASQIAARLGVTRNAVIGKVHRLCLPSRPTRPRARRVATAPARPAIRRAGAPREVLAPVEERPSRHFMAELEELSGEATLMTLGAHMCRWPIGDPSLEEFRLCGRAADAGPYCAHHSNVAYVTPRSRVAATARLMSSLRRVY